MAGKRYQVTIPEPLAEQLEKTCKENGMSKSIIMAIALKEYLKFTGKEQTDEQKK
jgi:metal-responsive CopG/Arc/MetJ family transcriptional regulator